VQEELRLAGKNVMRQQSKAAGALLALFLVADGVAFYLWKQSAGRVGGSRASTRTLSYKARISRRVWSASSLLLWSPTPGPAPAIPSFPRLTRRTVQYLDTEAGLGKVGKAGCGGRGCRGVPWSLAIGTP